ncbi:uncharacterized protein LOC135584231 isoform X3 [Musa acuminata AAA Group]|uniref:uncharacterized protein LOC135584231 isoform X3 n=1 Tax=Musa acuminata AAA Group TaxID=214697 RepID=UPI0031D07593
MTTTTIGKWARTGRRRIRAGDAGGGGGVGDDDDVVVAATRVQLRGRPLLGRPLPGRRQRLLRLVPALFRPPPLRQEVRPRLRPRPHGRLRQRWDFGFFNVWHGCSTQCLSDARRSEQASQTWRDLYVGKYLFLSKSCDITYGDPSVRIPHLNQPGCNWKIILYIIPRPGFQSPGGDSRPRSIMEPVPLTESGQLPAGFVLEDPDSHYIYLVIFPNCCC